MRLHLDELADLRVAVELTRSSPPNHFTFTVFLPNA